MHSQNKQFCYEHRSMNLEQAKKRLFNGTFLLGRSRRGKAVDALFAFGSAEAAVVLVDAVGREHPEADGILSRLLTIDSKAKHEMHAAVWAFWKRQRYATLLNKARSSEALRNVLYDALRVMPRDDEGNRTVFALWHRLDDKVLAEMISNQSRHAPGLEMDALFGLAQGDAERYLVLEDPDCSIFEKAYIMASDEQKRRINSTVLKNLDPRLVKAYVLAGAGGHEQELVLEALKISGDQDGLFEQVRGMTLQNMLELVAYWEHTGNLPDDSSRKKTVERAVALYRELCSLNFKASDEVPAGTTDMIHFWEKREVSDEKLQAELGCDDPMVRAGAIYISAKRGRISQSRLRDIARTGSWLEKLAARLYLPGEFPEKEYEHVVWLRKNDRIDARIFNAVIPGTIDDSQFFLDSMRVLGESEDASDKMLFTLLAILTTFQGHFLRGIVTLDENDDATQKGAVETEDAPGIEW